MVRRARSRARAEHLDRAEAPEAPRAYLDAALAQAAALQPERALALAERGAALAKGPDDVVALNMLRGRLRCESGEGQPAVDAYEVALAATRQPAERCRALIGIAAGHRLIAGVDAALAALAEAEPLARAAARARVVRAALHARQSPFRARRHRRVPRRASGGAGLRRGRSPIRCGRRAR